jgi:tripeptidyl-peptidase-1
VTFVTTVDKASNLLHATFKNYENGGSTKMRTTQYSVPNDLKRYIDLIFPTTYFGKTAANIPKSNIAERDNTPTHRSTRSIDPTCETLITPSCLKELYNIGNYTPMANSGSKIGFTSFVKQSAFKSDLQQYETYFNIPLQEFEIVTINGGINNQDPNNSYFRTGEAALDVQTIVGVSHPIPVTEFITGGTPPFVPTLDQPTPEYNENEPYLPFFNYLLSQPTLPQVITNSYGDDEESVPRYYATYVCNSIAMLGLRGVVSVTPIQKFKIIC